MTRNAFYLLAAIAVVTAAVAVFPLGVRAQESEQAPTPPPENDARAIFMRGQTAYQQGDYDTAIREWNAAYELDARPLIQFNLSQAYERLGRLDEASAALDRYLETAEADDEHQADARARRAALRERIARTGVTISGAPDGASIEVDGRQWGVTPRPDPIPVSAGSHRIVLRLGGYEDFQSSVAVTAGQTAELHVEMQQAQAGGADDSGGSILPFVAFGAAGAFVVTGSIFGVLALGAANDAPGPNTPKADSARGLALGADIFIGLGVIAAGTGVLLLVLDGDDESGSSAEEAQALRVTPFASSSEVGAAVSGGF